MSPTGMIYTGRHKRPRRWTLPTTSSPRTFRPRTPAPRTLPCPPFTVPMPPRSPPRIIVPRTVVPEEFPSEGDYNNVDGRRMAIDRIGDRIAELEVRHRARRGSDWD